MPDPRGASGGRACHFDISFARVVQGASVKLTGRRGGRAIVHLVTHVDTVGYANSSAMDGLARVLLYVCGLRDGALYVFGSPCPTLIT